MAEVLKSFMKSADYEIGMSIANTFRNIIAHTEFDNPIMWNKAATAGIFGIMMKYFSLAEVRKNMELPDDLYFDTFVKLIPDNIPHNSLRDFFRKLEVSRIRGWHDSLMRCLEDSGIFNNRKLLCLVFDMLKGIEDMPHSNSEEIYLAAAIELVLMSGSVTGMGMTSIAAIPLPIIYLLRELAEGKNNMQWYGATEDSMLLLPYCTAHKPGTVHVCVKTEHTFAQTVMILLMTSGRQKMEVHKISLPCIPHNESDIIGKCDRAFAFSPVFHALIPSRDSYICHPRTQQCIAWWPEYGRIDQWIYACHILQTLNEGGRGYVFMPLGLLSRTGGAEDIRKRIFEKNLLNMVIEFPSGTFKNARMPIALLVFQKGREEQTVYMLDLTGKEGRKLIQVDLRFQEVRFIDSEKLLSLIKNRREVKGLSRLVESDDIRESRYCFGPRAYVEEEYAVSGKDLLSLMMETEEIESKLSEINVEYKKAMEDYKRVKAQWEDIV